jgi:hypothetical protein
MKLTEQQGFKILEKINNHFNLNLDKEEIADFVMLELINIEIGDELK